MIVPLVHLLVVSLDILRCVVSHCSIDLCIGRILAVRDGRFGLVGWCGLAVTLVFDASASAMTGVLAATVVAGLLGLLRRTTTNVWGGRAYCDEGISSFYSTSKCFVCYP